MEGWFQITVEDEGTIYVHNFWKSGKYFYRCGFHNDGSVMYKTRRISEEDYYTAKFNS
ncbi:MAG: hypothetical protein IIT46_16315 [Lachnospiraceae bacterium]|nr:hypothetical protein [Lachnospiraceae bacterium]